MTPEFLRAASQGPLAALGVGRTVRTYGAGRAWEPMESGLR